MLVIEITLRRESMPPGQPYVARKVYVADTIGKAIDDYAADPAEDVEFTVKILAKDVEVIA